MKKILITSLIVIALSLFGIFYSSVSLADGPVNSGNTQQTQQTNMSNVGNSTSYKTEGSNNGNTTTYAQQTRTENSHNQINNSRQEIDNSYSSVKQEGIIGDGNTVNSGLAAGGSITTGATSVVTGVTTGSTNVNLNMNQVRQHRIAPMAWSPMGGVSMSQDNCDSTASLGVSTGLGGVSGGVPVGDDDCNRRKDVTMWMNLQQPAIACNRMIQSEENAEAMKKAGLTCEAITAAPAAAAAPAIPSTLSVPPNSYWDKADQKLNMQLDNLHKQSVSK